jgi:hypothetical protein
MDPVPVAPAAPSFPAAWYPDPLQRYAHRYWDGASWTGWVSDGERQFAEPVAAPAPPPGASDADELRWLLPVGVSGWAIAAGYAGLFAFLCFPGPIALVLGVTALVHLRKHPDLRGRGRAIFATVIGTLGTLLLLAALIPD